jgi:hypothetical protein
MKKKITKAVLAAPATTRKLRKVNPFTIRIVARDNSDEMFRQGQSARPHKKRGTPSDPESFGRAYVCKASGTGPEQRRDNRHPDLKVKARKAVTEPGTHRKQDSKPSFKRSGGFNKNWDSY